MQKCIKWTTAIVAIFTLFIVTSPSYAAVDDKSLVLYLSFDDVEGNTAEDGSVHGNDGELVANPKLVDGQFESTALEFDGAKSQYVKVPINDTLQLREKFSIAFWVKRGNNQIREWNYMVAAGELVWATIFNNNTKKTYLWSKAPGWAQKGITNEDQPEDWVHLTVTHDIDSDVSIYYDGKKVGGGAKPPAIIEIGGSIMVGARHPGSEFFTGTIDEVYLFNRVLTQAEIDAIRTGVFLPVEPKGKLATTWGAIKASHRQKE